MFIVHADNWAQIAELNASKAGTADLQAAIAQAKRVIQLGGDNAADTVRVYRKPAKPAMLERRHAVALVRRAGRGFHVEVAQGLDPAN